MQTVTKQFDVYSLEELSEDAQEKAHYDYLTSGIDYAWADENRESLKSFEDTFPVKIKDWEYACRNYINWEFIEEPEIEDLSGFRLAKYLWNNYKSDLYYGKYYSTPGKYIDGKYHYKSRHSNIILEDNCPTGYCVDYALLQPIRDFINKPTDKTFYDLMGECLESWIHDCRENYEDSQGFEHFAEASESNEWEYTEDGELYF